jgi:hypothetical protein
MDPLHLQGEINGFGSTFSSPKQILQIGGPYDPTLSFLYNFSLLIFDELDFCLNF